MKLEYIRWLCNTTDQKKCELTPSIYHNIQQNSKFCHHTNIIQIPTLDRDVRNSVILNNISTPYRLSTLA